MNHLISVWVCLISSSVLANVNPTIEEIRRAGYRGEEHRIATEDGYLLVLHRIPPSSPTSRVVVYFPGLFASSIDLVIRGRDKGFGFLLCDYGFDVWMANYRGTTEDPLMVPLNTTKKTDPWDFSWDENAKYDFPAIINYIVSATGVERVSTIGMSMAANVVLGGLNYHPRLNSRLSMNVFFAPTARLKHMQARLKMVGPHWRRFQKLRELTQVGWLPFINLKIFHQFLSSVCALEVIGDIICSSILYTTENIVFPIEKGLLPRIFQHYPHPGPTKSVIHYFQLMDSGRFTHFDYDTEENLRRYNQPSPPEYDLSMVTAPVAIFYSKFDTMVNYKDAEWLARSLSNSSQVLTYAVPRHNFAHLSFQWDPNIRTLVHLKVIDLLLSLR